MQSIKCVVVGDHNVGKSAFLNQVAAGLDIELPWNAKAVDVDVVTVQVKLFGLPVGVNLWDTSVWEGSECDKLRQDSYSQTDCFLVMFDLSNRKSFESVKQKWMDEIKNYLPNIPIVLVGAKADLRAKLVNYFLPSNINDNTKNSSNSGNKNKSKNNDNTNISNKNTINANTYNNENNNTINSNNNNYVHNGTNATSIKNIVNNTINTNTNTCNNINTADNNNTNSDQITEIHTSHKSEQFSSQEIYLNINILQSIFSYLPIPSLSRCEKVCKTWQAAINDKTLWQAFAHRVLGIPQEDFKQEVSWKGICKMAHMLKIGHYSEIDMPAVFSSLSSGNLQPMWVITKEVEDYVKENPDRHIYRYFEISTKEKENLALVLEYVVHSCGGPGPNRFRKKKKWYQIF
eukprot:Phypoly_transcript_06960.p1 GENE.Phypoly_transcript_06960~~Phypoly_transcript_06960.p1  ORF type:complete len:403 (+),score=39.70 Phypoly_transcript_06960:452-1660(+)